MGAGDLTRQPRHCARACWTSSFTFVRRNNSKTENAAEKKIDCRAKSNTIPSNNVVRSDRLT